MEVPQHVVCNGKNHIHIFSDASKHAYKAVTYFQYGGTIHLLMSKNRVAPTKQQTVPELELMSMTLAADLWMYIKSYNGEYLNSTAPIFCYDRQIALRCLRLQKLWRRL